MFRGVSLVSTLFLGACATTAPLPLGSDVGDAPVVADMSPLEARHARPADSADVSCDTIIRDLSVDWDSRDYWCDDGRLMVRQTVLLASLEKARQQLATMRESVDAIEMNTQRAVARIDSRLADKRQPVDTRSAVVHGPDRSSDRTSSSEPYPSSQILFARSRVVLGPRGRRAVGALSQRVASARHVTVRGHLTAGEFPLADSLDAERRSVGRSLSVKEAWRNAGVDVSSVTILHHSGRFSGPYVEVVFDD